MYSKKGPNNFHAKFHVFSRNGFAWGSFVQISVHNIIKHPHINHMDNNYSIVIVFFLFCGHYKLINTCKEPWKSSKFLLLCSMEKNNSICVWNDVNNDLIFISGAIKTSNGRIQPRNTHRAKVPCQHLGNSNDLIRLAGLI